MFQDTRPAELDGPRDAWAEFRVALPAERTALLRQLREENIPVMLNASDGCSMTSSLWAVDSEHERISFSVNAAHPNLGAVVEAEEVVAVAYLQSVKLQFDVLDLVLVQGMQACTLQAAAPREIYRFQRRGGYRVRTAARHAPTARLRHPAMPEMNLALRVLDISIGGCALWLPHDVPPLQAGTQLTEVHVVLDGDTQFVAALHLMHVTVLAQSERGARLGCEWRPLPGTAARDLQRWIDQAQKRRRLLSLD